MEDTKSPLTKGLPPILHRYDEWYAFASNPRSLPGFHILITADEKSYKPGKPLYDGRATILSPGGIASGKGMCFIRRSGMAG